MLSFHLPDSVALDVQPSQRGLLTTAVTRTQLLRLAMKGVNATRAAELVGCSPETARRHYADPSFRKHVLGKVDDAFRDVDAAFVLEKKSLHERISEQAERSFEELQVLLQDPELGNSLKVKIHQDFLNRAEDTAQVTKSLSANINPDQLLIAMRTAKEMDKAVINVAPLRREIGA